MIQNINIDNVIDELQNVKPRSKKGNNAIDLGIETIKLMMEQLSKSPEDRFSQFKIIYTNNMEAMEKINDEMEAELKEWRGVGKTSFSDIDNVDGLSLMIDDMYENIKDLKKINEKNKLLDGKHNQLEKMYENKIKDLEKRKDEAMRLMKKSDEENNELKQTIEVLTERCAVAEVHIKVLKGEK